MCVPSLGKMLIQYLRHQNAMKCYDHEILHETAHACFGK